MEQYHIPVLLEPSVSGLNINPAGCYVDCTFGGGGHSKRILEQLTTGRLVGFDQDADAIAHATAHPNLTLVEGNFKYLQNYLLWHGIEKVDGIFADLGVSSHHFDEQARGFSFRFDAPLDMRMNQRSALTAEQVLNQYSEEQLRSMFRLYGEVDNAYKLAQLIVQQRPKSPFKTIFQFKEAITPLVPKKIESKYLAKVFQALRIEVNQEMEALKALLEQSVGLLNSGGRLVIITYHSLEDRLVKNLMRTGNLEGNVIKDFYGNLQTPFKVITRKSIVPDDDELEVNSRSRSAKLRIAEKI